MKILKAACLALAALATAAPAAAQSGWTRIGRQAVGGDSDRQIMTVRGQPEFSEIMICVEDHGVALRGADLRFRDGRTRDLRIRSRIAAENCSRFIRLGGSERDIEAMEIRYDPASLGGQRAWVDLYAR